jgi:hypothetical protein
VLLELADESNRDRDLTQWHDLQRWLAGAEHRVTIPYSAELAHRVPPVAVRLRRDFGSLLALIRAHAMLHQATRNRDDDGRIIATLDDYTVVRDLIADVITQGVGQTVSAVVRDTVNAVKALAPPTGVMAIAVAESLEVDKSTASRRLRVAADGDYVRNLEDKRGKPGRWVIDQSLPEDVDLLPDPEVLRGCTGVAPADNALDQGGCTVAWESGGESGTAATRPPPPGFVPPTGPDRCGDCGFHVPTQGHRDGCPACGREILDDDDDTCDRCQPIVGVQRQPCLECHRHVDTEGHAPDCPVAKYKRLPRGAAGKAHRTDNTA